MATKNFVIQHTMVGPGHMQGEVVAFPDDIDTDRLVNLGAIRPATKDDGDPVAYGEGSQDVAGVFPSVPFDPTDPTAQQATALPQGEPANAAASLEAKEAAQDALSSEGKKK